jgi:DNA-binding CsgD family transcriptional regulator
MLLSVRRGELEVAKMHLDRARELISSMEERPGLMAPPIVAEYFLSRRQPDRVLDLVSRTLTVHSVDSRVIDEMVMLGARAAADLAVHARDQRDPQAVQAARQTLDDIVSLRRSFPTAPFDSLTPEDLTAPAQEALFVAEYARCAGEATSSAWENAVRFCDAAEMRWEQGIASWRWAQALADEGAGPATIATPLRAAHRYAVEMGAAPLQHELEGLATLARIPLKEKESLPVDRLPAAFVALTKRELEVLSHLVAGHTYVEIAHSLFISEKTVSVHVSNLLRKTGTSSRREVSALARRLDMG